MRDLHDSQAGSLATRIVQGVGTATTTDGGDRSEFLQATMALAVTQALADGISPENAEELIKRKMAARDDAIRLMDEHPEQARVLLEGWRHRDAAGE